MQSSVTETRPARTSRLNWGLILSMVGNAVMVLGIVFLLKAVLTLGLVRVFGAE